MAKLVKDNGDKYESRPFSVGGFNSTLLIYPNANKPVGSGGYVSMYVRLDNSTLIANPRDVYAEITFLTYKSTIDKYHFFRTDPQRSHLFKQQWGQLDFLEIAYYQNPEYGFIFDGGQSVFGVDILVANPFEKWEVFSYDQNIRNRLLDWKLTHFSTRYLDSYTADPFPSGGRNWVLKVYPNGAGPGTGNSLSLFLLSASNESGYVQAKLRVIDRIRTTYVEKQGMDGVSTSLYPLADIRDASKGFLVNDNLKVEVEIVSFSKTDSV